MPEDLDLQSQEWIKSDLGTGTGPRKITSKVNFPYPNMNIPFIEINVRFDAYKKINNWASIGRHFDSLLSLLAEITATDGEQEQDIIYKIEDIEDLRSAFEAFHEACRNHLALEERKNVR